MAVFASRCVTKPVSYIFRSYSSTGSSPTFSYSCLSAIVFTGTVNVNRSDLNIVIGDCSWPKLWHMGQSVNSREPIVRGSVFDLAY